jgi:phosphoglycerate dehydrogenase-like enzyme
MHKALYILNEEAFRLIYGPAEQAQIARLVDVIAPPITPEAALARPDLLQQAEIILSGWGAPKFDAHFLELTPKLRAVFYGAGSVRNIISETFWERDIVLSNAYAANAVPVSEFTVASILLSLKQAWKAALANKGIGEMPDRRQIPGAYGRTVALISLGMIGRLVRERLKPFDLKVIAFDPFLSDEAADELEVERVSLEEAFARGDVISLHTPLLDETIGMVRREHFAAMKPQATFINTSRGRIVDEPGLIEVLTDRPDLQAVLDVTYPEPPLPGSPLYSLPNVILTPHIAGSMGEECHRMARYMIDELRLFLDGQPMQWQLTRQKAALLA